MSNADLEQRIQRMEDIEAVKKVVYRFQQACDKRDWVRYGDAYTHDAVVIIQGGAGGTLRGPEEIVKTAVDTFFSVYPVTQHFMTNIDVEITGTDTAVAHAETILIALRDPARPNDYYIGGGSYDWRFRRTPKGWKFAHYEVSFHWNNAQLEMA